MWSGGHCRLKDNVSFQVSGNGIPTTELAAPRQESKSWHPWLLVSTPPHDITQWKEGALPQRKLGVAEM